MPARMSVRVPVCMSVAGHANDDRVRQRGQVVSRSRWNGVAVRAGIVVSPPSGPAFVKFHDLVAYVARPELSAVSPLSPLPYVIAQTE